MGIMDIGEREIVHEFEMHFIYYTVPETLLASALFVTPEMKES